MSVIGSIAVNVVMRSGAFVKNAQRARKSLSEMDKAGRMVRRTIVGIGSAIATAKLTNSFLSTAKAIDETAKASRRLGVASENLVGLRHAADQTAGAGDKLDMSLQRMTRRIAEAANGSGEAVKALRELRLDAAKLSRMTPDRAFLRVADAMREVKSQGDRVRLSFKLFDSEGVDLVNTLKVGSKEIQRYVREAKGIGIAFSAEEAAKVEKMNDELDRLSKHFNGELTRLVIDVGPYVAETVKGLRLVMDGIGRYKPKTLEGTAALMAFKDLRRSHDRRRDTINQGLIDSGIATSAGRGGFTRADGFTRAELDRLARYRGPRKSTMPRNLEVIENLKRRDRMEQTRKNDSDAVNAVAKLFARKMKEQADRVFRDGKGALSDVRKFGDEIRSTVKQFQAFQRRRKSIEEKRETEQREKRNRANMFRGNPLLEATSAEGYRALRQGRGEMIDKQQLNEAKKQTAKLDRVAKGIERIAIVEHEV